MKVLYLAMIFMLLSGCDNASKRAEKYAESVIGSSLKDPYTAKYSSFSTHIISQGKGYPDMVHVCGLVNAKNNFGAYAGNSRFVVSFLDGDKQELIYKTLEEPNSNAPTAYWNKHCSGTKI